MSTDERWVKPVAETMLETFRWFCGEGFGLIAPPSYDAIRDLRIAM